MKAFSAAALAFFLASLAGCLVHEPHRHQSVALQEIDGALCISINNNHDSRRHPP